MTAETEESRQRWDAVAGGWARRRDLFAETVAPVTDALVSLLAPREGDRILELAAGPGGVGFHVAPLVGPAGSVLVTDFSPEMVTAAEERARALGLGNVAHAVVDGQDTGLDAGTYDGVVCRFGYMLMPEPVRGLSETARLLRPAGRVAFAIWGDRRANSWGTATLRALVELGHLERPDPYGPGPFALDEHDRLAAAVAAGGLELEHVEDVQVVWRLPSLQAWWEVMADLSSHLTDALARLGGTELERLQERAAAHLEHRPDGDGVAVDGLARVVLARPR